MNNFTEQENIPLSSRILYQSTECVVVNKLKGEATEGAVRQIVSLPRELKAVLPADTQLIEAVNRVDVPVTGCAIFALTQDSLVFLNSVFSEKGSPLIKKHYWAITEKPPQLPDTCGEYTELVHWIEINKKLNKSLVYYESAQDCKKASLRYKIIGKGDNYLFSEIDLITGRHHQIRAQFAMEGMPVKGDLKYGAKRSEKDGGIRLHARSLSFPDPLNKTEIVHVTADPPYIDNLWTDFMKLIK
ncbi:MAG: RNA pseudouridine synthase [Treponema sp.]|jgi:23S rRNA pseudouridine1911/1915/1917 synthase|nr:RNA pseudouridine synthase [Treponema sp.]